VLSEDEVRRLLAAFRSPVHHTIATLCYGAGLRATEACGLRIEDIDGERQRLLIRHATKGAKHRHLPRKVPKLDPPTPPAFRRS